MKIKTILAAVLILNLSVLAEMKSEAQRIKEINTDETEEYLYRHL